MGSMCFGGRLVKNGVEGTRSCFVKSTGSVALPVWMTDSLYSQDDILLPHEKEVPRVSKSKAERKLMTSTTVVVEEEDKVEGERGMKRGRDDDDEEDEDLEKSFEEKRARKLAKQKKSQESKGVKAIKAKPQKEFQT